MQCTVHCSVCTHLFSLYKKPCHVWPSICTQIYSSVCIQFKVCIHHPTLSTEPCEVWPAGLFITKLMGTKQVVKTNLAEPKLSAAVKRKCPMKYIEMSYKLLKILFIYEYIKCLKNIYCIFKIAFYCLIRKFAVPFKKRLGVY